MAKYKSKTKQNYRKKSKGKSKKRRKSMKKKTGGSSNHEVSCSKIFERFKLPQKYLYYDINDVTLCLKYYDIYDKGSKKTFHENELGTVVGEVITKDNEKLGEIIKLVTGNYKISIGLKQVKLKPERNTQNYNHATAKDLEMFKTKSFRFGEYNYGIYTGHSDDGHIDFEKKTFYLRGKKQGEIEGENLLLDFTPPKISYNLVFANVSDKGTPKDSQNTSVLPYSLEIIIQVLPGSNKHIVTLLGDTSILKDQLENEQLLPTLYIYSIKDADVIKLTNQKLFYIVNTCESEDKTGLMLTLVGYILE